MDACFAGLCLTLGVVATTPPASCQVALQVRRDGRGDFEGSPHKEVVRPSSRREMATCAVKCKGRSIRRACELFSVSPTCHRYEPKSSNQNEQIADWLVRLTHNQRDRFFGLCYLRLRDVKGFVWNHKRV
jgi:hypothetical protein